MGRSLPRGFYARDTNRVARDLLGCVLQTRFADGVTVGLIVEVEAYVGPDDPAAHGFRNRKSRRNQALFGPPGSAYVYRSYGIHWCVNAVTVRDGYPAAVLIRSLEPLAGLAVMEERRGAAGATKLCAGPGRLCQALGITGADDGRWLQRGPVRVLRSARRRRIEVGVSSRIGISKATDRPLRFFIEGSPWLSR